MGWLMLLYKQSLEMKNEKQKSKSVNVCSVMLKFYQNLKFYGHIQSQFI